MSVTSDRIKQRRDELGLSLAELARRVGISKGYLHSIEGGDTQNPSAEILFKIANELDTTIAYLLGEDVPRYAAEVDIPDELKELANELSLTESDVQMLAHIEYRGRRPKSKDDWRFLYESIRRSLS